jgi:hypothetical protein
MEYEDKSTNGSTKPKLIRNRDVDKAARVLAEDHALPEPPGNKLSWTQMFEYLSLLTPEMWSHLSIYVYRLRPKIRRQLKDPNSPNYIDCYGEPFTEAYFIGRHGGGKFMLQAVDSEKKKTKDGHGQEVFQCFHEIDDVKHEPILDYSELEMTAKENQSYITWLVNKGILDSKGNIVQDRNTPAAAVNGSMSAKDILEILKYVSTMNAEQQNQLKSRLAPEHDAISKSVGDILLEKMRQDDPAKQVQIWSGLVGGLKEIIGTSKSDTGISQVYDKLITMQQTNTNTVMSLIERVLQNQNQTQQRTALDDFDKVFALLDRARQWGGSGGRRTGWDIGYDIARDIGLPIVQTFSSTLTNIMALRRGGATPAGAVPGAPTVPAAFDPYREPAAAAAYAKTQQAATTPTPTQPPAPPPPPPPAPPPGGAEPAATPPSAAGTSPELLQIFQQYGNLVFQALNNGTPGYAFADYISGLLGTTTHAMLANHGEDTLVSTMLGIQEFQLFGETRIRSFVHEFIHFEEFQEEDEGIEPDEITNVYRPRERREEVRR